jgi:hypothetical protein
MSMTRLNQAELPQLVVGDAPVSRMAPRGIPISRERTVAAARDSAMRHIEPTPRVVTVPAVGESGLAPPTGLLGVSAKFTFLFHEQYYTNSSRHHTP